MSSPHTSYITDYRGHLAFTQDHLAGVDDGAPPPSSHVPPTGYWTPTEKNIFFHALSIHSRLRPDLIAACIPTKTIVDVCTYMDVLEAAAAEAPTLQEGELRRALPCAMEVSDGWVEREEEGGAWLAAVEPTWEREAILAARAGEIEKAQSGEDGDEPRQLGLDDGQENRSKELEARWGKEDLLDCLGEIHLDVIDSIIQAADEKNTGKRKRSDSDAGDTGTRSPQPVSLPSQADNVSLDLTALSSVERRRLRKRLYMRRKRAEQTGNTVVTDVGKLKPGRKENKVAVNEAREDDNGKLVKGQDETDSEHDMGEGERMDKGILHTPKRIKRDLEQLGIDHDGLRDEGLSLLHTSALWRFMTRARLNKYNLRARTSKKNPDAGPSISANTIRMLEAALVSFTIGLVRLTILSCVEESRRKTHTKVWRVVKDEIAPRSVEHALEIIGFGGLFRYVVEEREEEMEEEEETIGGPDPFPELLSPHREIYTPVLRLQPSESTSLDADLLPEDTDEEELVEELLEEAELNKRDRGAERDYEKRLWGSDGSTGGDGAAGVGDEGAVRSDEDDDSEDENEHDDI